MKIKENDQHRYMRKVVFTACAIVTVSVFSVIVVLPVMFTSVQQQKIIFETNYCKMCFSDMLMNLYHTCKQNRVKRGWLFGQWVPDSGVGG